MFCDKITPNLYTGVYNVVAKFVACCRNLSTNDKKCCRIRQVFYQLFATTSLSLIKRDVAMALSHVTKNP